MKFIFFVSLSFFFFLISCQSGTSGDGGTQKEFITDAPPEAIDTAVNFEITLEDSSKTELQKYFTPELIQRIEKYFTE